MASIDLDEIKEAMRRRGFPTNMGRLSQTPATDVQQGIDVPAPTNPISEFDQNPSAEETAVRALASFLSSRTGVR